MDTNGHRYDSVLVVVVPAEVFLSFWEGTGVATVGAGAKVKGHKRLG